MINGLITTLQYVYMKGNRCIVEKVFLLMVQLSFQVIKEVIFASELLVPFKVIQN